MPQIKQNVLKSGLKWTTPPPTHIKNNPPHIDFGIVNPNSAYWSNGTPPEFPLDDNECYFTVKNTGDVPVNINIQGSNFSGGVGWGLVTGQPGQNQVRIKAGRSGDQNEDAMVTLTTSSQPFIYSLSPGSSKKWEIKMETGTFTDGVKKHGRITLIASASGG